MKVALNWGYYKNDLCKKKNQRTFAVVKRLLKFWRFYKSYRCQLSVLLKEPMPVEFSI